MRSAAHTLVVVFCSLACLSPAGGGTSDDTAAPAAPGPPAFPGAEGFGASTRGGRGGRAIAVTRLDDYASDEAAIPGTLRAACEASGPRTVVFRVSGTISLKDTLRIDEPYITIAGQSAPGGGICLRDHGVSIRTHEVIVRYLRVRPGDREKREVDALSIGRGSRNVVIDHCSTSWGNDEVLSVSGEGITGVTVQWCFITESLDRSVHHKGRHGYGSLIRTNGNITFHHNLYAHHRSRSPRPGTYGEGSILLDFRNNVIYQGGRGYAADDPARLNYVGNYIRATVPFVATGTTQMFVAENTWQRDESERDDEPLVRGLPEANRRSEPFAVAPVATDGAGVAYEKVLESGGATLPRRDEVDRRIVAQVRAGSGRPTIDSQADVGGWPELASSEPAADEDGDGMPDAWERLHGLNPADAADGPADKDRDGFTNLEECLNGSET